MQHSVYRQIDGWGFQTTLIGRDGYCTYITSERVTTTMWPTSTTAYPYHMKPYYLEIDPTIHFLRVCRPQCVIGTSTLRTSTVCQTSSSFFFLLFFSSSFFFLLLLLDVVPHVCNSMTSGVLSTGAFVRCARIICFGAIQFSSHLTLKIL